VVYQPLPQCLAPYEADNATSGIGDLLLQGLLADSQRPIQQELLRICRFGRSELVLKISGMVKFNSRFNSDSAERGRVAVRQTNGQL
jgi:hypothetical protein